jgi:hypothetical protein
MIERRRRPLGRDFLLDMAALLPGNHSSISRTFSSNNAIKHTRSPVSRRQRQAILDVFDETHRQRAQILESGLSFYSHQFELAAKDFRGEPKNEPDTSW